MQSRYLLILPMLFFAGSGQEESNAAGPTLSTGAEIAHRVMLGQGMETSNGILMAHGATEITQYIQTGVPAPARLRWYKLQDGTCLEVLLTPKDNRDDYVVEHLTLGEKGRGYGDMLKW